MRRPSWPAISLQNSARPLLRRVAPGAEGASSRASAPPDLNNRLIESEKELTVYLSLPHPFVEAAEEPCHGRTHLETAQCTFSARPDITAAASHLPLGSGVSPARPGVAAPRLPRALRSRPPSE